MYIYNLVLEITRRCNLACEHCMRGSAQRFDINKETLWNALNNVDCISSLTLTGGEPSLKPELIREVYDIIRFRNIELGSFYVVTNAKSTYRRKEFLDVLDDLYEWADEKELCTLCVSQDQFHTSLHQPNMRYFEGSYKDDYGYGYCQERPYFSPEQRKNAIVNVINEGRAEETGCGSADKKSQSLWEVYINTSGDLEVLEAEVYISANGNVTSCCDMSFKRIDEEAVGNINKEPLKDIILRHCTRIDEKGEIQMDKSPNVEEKVYV